MDNPNRFTSPGEEHYYRGGKLQERSPFYRRHAWKILTCVLLVVVILLTVLLLNQRPQVITVIKVVPTVVTLISPTAAPASEPTQPPAPTPTPIPVWHGCSYSSANPNGWNDWQTTGGWSILDGTYIFDGRTRSTVQAPPGCQPTTPNYAVEVTVMRLSREQAFNVIVRATSPYQGYASGLDGGCDMAISFADQVDNRFLGITPARSFCDGQYHTYRTEVSGNTIRLYGDKTFYTTAKDNTFLSPGLIYLYSIGSQIQISSFKVEPL